MLPKVLFLQDEQYLVDSVPMILKEKGLNVKSTTVIGEAIAWLAQESFDVVLLDIMIPPEETMDPEMVNYGRETGVEVIRRMKDVKPDTPIVVFSLIRDEKILSKAWDAGAIGVVQWPCASEHLADVLWDVIEG